MTVNEARSCPVEWSEDGGTLLCLILSQNKAASCRGVRSLVRAFEGKA